MNGGVVVVVDAEAAAQAAHPGQPEPVEGRDAPEMLARRQAFEAVCRVSRTPHSEACMALKSVSGGYLDPICLGVLRGLPGSGSPRRRRSAPPSKGGRARRAPARRRARAAPEAGTTAPSLSPRLTLAAAVISSAGAS